MNRLSDCPDEIRVIIIKEAPGCNPPEAGETEIFPGKRRLELSNVIKPAQKRISPEAQYSQNLLQIPLDRREILG